ncbi:MAG: hypothetical protein KDC93_12310 [Cyclobacteriaceae bacterium]|nr:hypothetical protein [Cyclobacteriaceae bacterium]
MKLTKLIGIYALLFVTIGACSPKTESATEEIKDEETAEWKGMDDFHMLMAESFHPYRDSANVEPVKQYAKEMVVSVNNWIEQELPAKVDNDKVKQTLKDLQDGAVALADLVEVGDDQAIGESLTALHDTFHQLQEAWYKKDK